MRKMSLWGVVFLGVCKKKKKKKKGEGKPELRVEDDVEWGKKCLCRFVQCVDLLFV